jgi:hypothetical protein
MAIIWRRVKVKMLNPNCSEAVYKIKANTLMDLSEKELEILKDLIGDELLKPDSKNLDYRPYFENADLDLFLDYFQIPSNRNHWTCSATSSMNREDYNTEMKSFCDRFGLEFRDVYNKRHMGDDVDDVNA